MTADVPAASGPPGGLRPPATFAYMGGQLVELDAQRGYAKTIYQGRAEFCNPGGVIQGGFLTAMLDDVMSLAAVAQQEFKRVVPTLDFKASFLAPVGLGDIIAEGWILKAGHRIVYLEGKLHNAKGELAVAASATAQLKDIKG